MRDIVEKLRTDAYLVTAENLRKGTVNITGDLMGEAATEIERLRIELRRSGSRPAARTSRE